jgi:hypothetical protein
MVDSSIQLSFLKPTRFLSDVPFLERVGSAFVAEKQPMRVEEVLIYPWESDQSNGLGNCTPHFLTRHARICPLSTTFTVCLVFNFMLNYTYNFISLLYRILYSTCFMNQLTLEEEVERTSILKISILPSMRARSGTLLFTRPASSQPS